MTIDAHDAHLRFPVRKTGASDLKPEGMRPAHMLNDYPLTLQASNMLTYDMILD